MNSPLSLMKSAAAQSASASRLQAQDGDNFASSGATGSNANSAAGSSERFLRLLVAQMQNQDPLNPMDNAQVTSQMAQINTVTGIDKLNTSVEGLSAQFVQMQALQGASLVGREVVVPGNYLNVGEGGLSEGGFELAGPADQVKVEVLSASGQVLDTVNLGAQSSGLQSFTWQGASNASNADGLRFRVTATRGSATVNSVAYMQDEVQAVRTSGSALSLELRRSGAVPYSVIKSFS